MRHNRDKENCRIDLGGEIKAANCAQLSEDEVGPGNTPCIFV